jgi:hypothetical protein
MYDTINTATGQVQHMVYPADSIEIDSKGVSLAGLPKGMEQVQGLPKGMEQVQSRRNYMPLETGV